MYTVVIGIAVPHDIGGQEIEALHMTGDGALALVLEKHGRQTVIKIKPNEWTLTVTPEEFIRLNLGKGD